MVSESLPYGANLVVVFSEMDIKKWYIINRGLKKDVLSGTREEESLKKISTNNSKKI